MLSVETSAVDSVLIEFVPVIGNPKIAGVEVIEINGGASPTENPAATPAPTPVFEDVLINCGGDEYTESSGERVWLADQYFVGGSIFTDETSPIDGTQDDEVRMLIQT